MEKQLVEKDGRVELRLAEKADQSELKRIWKLCFGDPDPYIDFYFKIRNWMLETAVLLEGGTPVSMLTMIPVHMIDADGVPHGASMIFAVATHPEHQKQGYADRLLEFANRHLASNQTMRSLLVPAGEDLFRFYGKRGYKNWYFVREAKLNQSELAAMNNLPYGTDSPGIPVSSTSNKKTAEIHPAKPSEYNRIRRIRLIGCVYLDYRDDEILFEKQTAVMSGADIYTVRFSLPKTAPAGDAEGSGPAAEEGCFYAERASDDLVVIKELLVPDECLPAVLRSIAELLPAKEYIIRTPVDRGLVLGGKTRPFGMVRINREDGRPAEHKIAPAEQGSYLGIAYD